MDYRKLEMEALWVLGPREFLSRVNTLLIKKVLEYMSEVIISRRGGGKSNENEILITEVILKNTNWRVPKEGIFSIRIFGGGGGGSAGGGSTGWQWCGCRDTGRRRDG